MNLSDYILKFLISKKIDNVFLITGGAISFLVDSFSRTKKKKAKENNTFFRRKKSDFRAPRTFPADPGGFGPGRAGRRRSRPARPELP